MGEVISFERYLTKEQLADRLQMSTRWIELQVKNENMPCRKFGRSVRFRLDEVEPWLERRYS